MPAASRAEADLAEVSAPIVALNAALVAVMKAGKAAPFPKRYALLEPVVVKAFNLALILQRAVGFGWSDIPAPQQRQLLDVFRQYTVASYVANFNSYSGEQFRVLPGMRTVGQARVVESEIIRPGKGPVRINYVMQQNAGAWQVVDVLLDGTISQVAVQRSDFSSLLAPGNATALMSALKKKVGTLSGNTIS